MTRQLVNLEAEQSTIGALLLNNDLIEVVSNIVSPLDFSDPDLAEIYAISLSLRGNNKPVDVVTIADKKQTLQSGNSSILVAGTIARNTPSYANAISYANAVKERAEARKIVQLADKIRSMAYQSRPIPEIVADIQNMALSINSLNDDIEVVSLADALGDVIDKIDDRFNNRGINGLETGLVDLDKIVKGIRPSNMVVVAGRPGTGKTTLAINIAEHNAYNHNKSCMIFSLEMSKEELAERSLASFAKISVDDINSGEAVGNNENIAKLTCGVQKIKGVDIRICDKPALTIGRIRTIARFQHKLKPLDLIVIDYIGLISPEGNNKNSNRNLDLGVISHSIKAMAKELNIPVIVLAQLNRHIESRADKRPQMSDLRDSGEIEQDADIIIMAHRDNNEEKGQNGITELNVIKHRHSQLGCCQAQLQGMYSRFVNCAYQTDSRQPPPKKTKSAKLLIGSFKDKSNGMNL